MSQRNVEDCAKQDFFFYLKRTSLSFNVCFLFYEDILLIILPLHIPKLSVILEYQLSLNPKRTMRVFRQVGVKEHAD